MVIENQKNSEFSFVCVSGYGWSGSGAIVDLLRGNDRFFAPSLEFSILWEPGGILDLESSLIPNWDPLRHHVALKDFISYSKLMSSKSSFWNLNGGNYSHELNVDFDKVCNDYVNSLTEMEYFGSSRIFNYKTPLSKLFLRRVFNKILPVLNLAGETVRFSKKSEKEFIEITQDFIEKIFVNKVKTESKDFVLLDQAVQAWNVEDCLKYFKDPKLIIVDRDPRDIFCDLIEKKVLIGADINRDRKECAKKYVQYFNSLRCNGFQRNVVPDNDERILRLKFEDIVTKPLLVKNKLEIFLDIDIPEMSNGYFKPSDSLKNIGKWRDSKFEDEMNFVAKELNEYCFHG